MSDQAETEFQPSKESLGKLTDEQWVSQSLALIQLARTTGQTPSSSQLLTNLFKTIGLSDVQLWEQQAKSILSLSPGEVGSLSDIKAQRRLTALLDATDSELLGDVLKHLESDEASHTLGFLWIFVGCATRSLGTTVSRPRALEFFRLLAPPVADAALHLTPTNADWISTMLLKLTAAVNSPAPEAATPKEECTFLVNILHHSVRRLDVKDKGFFQQLELVHSLATALKNSDIEPGSHSKVVAATNVDIKLGSRVFYSTLGEWVEHTVACIEESDVEKVFTLVDSKGHERQTVASRVFTQPPAVEKAASSDSAAKSIIELLVAQEKQLRDTVVKDDGGKGVLRAVVLTDIGACVSFVRVLLKSLNLRQTTSRQQQVLAFLAEAHAWWTGALIEGCTREAGDNEVAAAGSPLKTVAALGILTACLETDASIFGALDLEPSVRLFPKVVALPTGSEHSGIGLSEAIVSWTSAVIGRTGVGRGDAARLWDDNSRHFISAKRPGQVRLMDADLKCVGLLLTNVGIADDSPAGALFAIQLLAPIFLATLESESKQHQGVCFESVLRESLLEVSIENLIAATLGAQELSGSHTVLSAIGPQLEGLYGAVTNSTPSAQLCAFSVLRLLPTKCPPLPPQPLPPASAAAAAEEAGEAANGMISSTVLEQMVIPKGLQGILRSQPKAIVEEGEVLGGIDVSTLLGILVPCLLLLDFFEANTDDKALFNALGEWARGQPLFPRALGACALCYQEFSENSAAAKQRLAAGKQLFTTQSLDSLPGFLANREREKQLYFLAGHALFRCVCVLPSLVRGWWSSECPRSLEPVVQAFVETEIGDLIAKREVGAVLRNNRSVSHELLTVQASHVSREISAVYVKEDCSLEVIIRLPLAFPLKNVEVECRKQLGVTDQRWRRWVLQIVSLLSTQDGSVLDAIVMWKNNVDKEFEGLEPCPICYSILHPKSLALPTLKCQTCNAAFHKPCLFKWFNTSHKSKCPHCQQPFSI